MTTERAKRVKIRFSIESIEHLSIHDGGWSIILDVWCDREHDDADPGFAPFERILPVNGKITASDVPRESHEGNRPPSGRRTLPGRTTAAE